MIISKLNINKRFAYYILFSLCALLSLTSCNTHRKGISGVQGPSSIVVTIPEYASEDARKIIEESYTWLGTPYKYAADEKGKGTDCSGMVCRVYNDILNVKLPRNSARQFEFVKHIKHSKIRPGDLAFFATGKDKNKISHVGIMIDDVHFIHASASKGVVISRIDTRYYTETSRGFGRVR